jgi:hypothetical protein
MLRGGKNNARIINVLQAIGAELGGGGGGKPAFKKNKKHLEKIFFKISKYWRI